jgi:hypothetical protein
VALELQRRGYEVVGIDNSPIAVEVSRRLARSTRSSCSETTSASSEAQLARRGCYVGCTG